MRYVGIKNIVFKTIQNNLPKQISWGIFFLPSPSWVFFPLVLVACQGDVYCQCSGPRQVWAGAFSGRVNSEATGNSVPEELCRHCAMAGWLAGRQLNGWGECVG